MPGDRRQILSLLRLPIPPLQPISFLSVNRPNCKKSCGFVMASFGVAVAWQTQSFQAPQFHFTRLISSC